MTTSVSLEHIEVSYGTNTVLQSVSADVAGGGWLGVLGPNGSGKSSLLKTLVGAVEYGGIVRFNGGEIEQRTRKERARTIAYIPQRPIYPQGMSVFDYVMLGRTPYLGRLGAESGSDIDQCWAALAELSMTDFAERDVATLSGGETQRISLARVLTQQANIVVLDEATASLDVAAQHEVLELIDRLRKERGITIIAAIHDLTAAAQFCDTVCLLDDGAVVGQGSPGNVLTEDKLGAVFEESIRVIDVDGSTVIVALRDKETPS